MFSHKDTVYLHAKKTRAPGEPYQEFDYDPLLAIHRFVEVEKTEVCFAFPDNYDFEKMFNANFGIIKEDAVAVEVELTGYAATYVSERIWSPDQQIEQLGDGKIKIRFTSASEDEFMTWLLSFGDEAHLLKPRHLVEKVRRKIAHINFLYN